MKKAIQILTLTALTACLTGCIGPNDFTPAKGMSPADIFASTCQTCHGENGAGKFGFLLGISGSDESMEEIAAKIGEGSTLMPSFPNISDEDRLSLAAYVKAL